LKDEVDYLENYIEFEKIRLGERLSLKADINATSVEDYMIAPMVLIVFVENAFKHAKNTADSQIYIDISLKTWNNRIFFSVKNSYSRQEKPFDRNSGFGLDNVRKRLTLLYPGAYELDVQANNVLYTITLQLKNRNNHEQHPLSDS
jgi:LytS/YehU family sensor histidine kinase